MPTRKFPLKPLAAWLLAAAAVGLTADDGRC